MLLSPPRLRELSKSLQQQVEDFKRALPLLRCRMLGLGVDDLEGPRDGKS
jgi:hypothetical protein